MRARAATVCFVRAEHGVFSLTAATATWRQARAIACGIVVAAFALPAIALDDAEVAAVRAELALLKARIAELEARLATDTTTPESDPVPPAAAASPAPSPARVAATPAITAGGRVKLDVIVNSTSAGGGSENRANLALSPAAIPISGDKQGEQIKFSARNSRVWLKAFAPTPLGDLASYIELDFFSSGSDGNESVVNGYEPRLRHAYGQWGEWLGGQTYSTVIDLDAYPEINDDGGPLGVLLVRQALVRWRREWRGFNFNVGLESPDSLVRGSDGRRLSPDDERLPDLALRVEQRHRWGHISIAALGREIRIDQAGTDDAAFGGMLSVSGLVRFAGRDDVRFLLSGGNAIGRYLNSGFVDDARIDAGGKLDLVTAAGGYVAYRHWWSRNWRSNLLFGATWLDDNGALPEENERAYSVHANLLWSPWLTTSLGIEWIHAERERVDGRDGAIDRVQFTTIHKF